MPKAYTRKQRDKLDQQTPGTPYVIYRKGKGKAIPVVNQPSKGKAKKGK